jgi:hypothetical protein
MSPLPLRSPSRQTIGVLLATVVAAGVLVTTPAAAAGPVVAFHPVVGACNPRGNATPNLRFRLTIRSSGGSLKLDRTITTDGDGSWAAPCGKDIAAGDVLTAKRNGTPIRTFTVPRLTLTIDRKGDILTGSAPKAEKVTVIVRSCEAQSMGCEDALNAGHEVAANGSWTWPVGELVDIRGTDDVTIIWFGAKDDTVEAIFYPPSLRVRRGSPGVFVTGVKPGGTTTVTSVRDGSAFASLTTTASPFGYAGGALKRNGTKAAVRVGDTVRLKGIADVRLAVTDTTVSFSPDGLDASGLCQPNGTGAISALTGSGDATFESGPDGSFSATMSDPVAPGDKVLLICATPAGDALWRTVTVD